MLKKLKELFQARESEYVYVSIIVNGTLEIQRKYICLEYCIGEKEKRIKDTILSCLNITDYYQSYSDFSILVVRDGEDIEYKAEDKVKFLKYDTVFLFLVKEDK